MKNFAIAALILFSGHGFAGSPDAAINRSNILKCVLLYEYDFVSEFLGITLDIAPDSRGLSRSKATIDQAVAQQWNDFVSTGKLKLRPNTADFGIPLTKDLARRCQIVAEAIVEARTLHMEQEQDTNVQPKGEKF